MTLIKRTFKTLAAKPGQTEDEKNAAKELESYAEEQETYNIIYEEALPIARSGDKMELDMYFLTIEKNFLATEKRYNRAVDELKAKGPEMDELTKRYKRQML